MAHQRVLIYGAGGHGKVVLDILERIAEYEIVGWVDDDPTRSGRRFCGYPILGSLEVLLERGVQEQVVVAIGDNKTREDLVRRLESEGWEFAIAIHPSASIARDVTLDSGTVVMANVAVNSGTVVGRHVILNTGATVDHDCAIGDSFRWQRNRWIPGECGHRCKRNTRYRDRYGKRHWRRGCRGL